MKELYYSNNIDTSAFIQHKTNISIIDDIFGGAITFPSFFMLYGNPGTGKTTFLCQICNILQQQNIPVAALIGEMNINMTANLCKRININIPISDNNDIDYICDIISKYKFVIIDSLKTITYDKNKYKFKKSEFEDYCILRIKQTAEKYNSCVGLIVHVTKSGTYRGSTYITHMVDIQMSLKKLNNQIVMEVVKNRTGPTGTWNLEMNNNGYTFKKPALLTRFFHPLIGYF